ncbi:MAG TPA: hypothetical protein VF027_04375 [Sphingomicrobium sp.]
MENDSIRASGSDTLVDIWINGKLRAISVSHEAIGAYVGFESAGAMSDDDRCEFVRTHLPLVIAAAKSRLRDTDPTANAVVIDAGDLPRPGGRGGDRRSGERRKGERRKSERPISHPDRRRGDRRKGQRRTRPAEPKGTKTP